MAVSVVGGSESGKEVIGRSLVLKNACICFRTSFSWVGNNPSLQIHSYCENRAKCEWTCDPNDEVFSSVLTKQDLLVADSSYQLWYEAYELSLSLWSHLLLMPCWEASPTSNNFLQKCLLKDDSARRKCVYIVAFCLYTDYSPWFNTYPHSVSIFTSP